MSDPFDTLNEAVFHAANAARAKYKNKEEAIGLVYQDPKTGKYLFTEPYSTNPDNRKTKAKFRIPKGSLRYIVHNHPRADANDQFSHNDVSLADKLGVPSAIIFGKDPVIRTYTPGKTNTRTQRRGSQRQKISRGDEFIRLLEESLDQPIPTRSTNDILVTGEVPKKNGTY